MGGNSRVLTWHMSFKDRVNAHKWKQLLFRFWGVLQQGRSGTLGYPGHRMPLFKDTSVKGKTQIKRNSRENKTSCSFHLKKSEFSVLTEVWLARKKTRVFCFFYCFASQIFWFPVRLHGWLENRLYRGSQTESNFSSASIFVCNLICLGKHLSIKNPHNRISTSFVVRQKTPKLTSETLMQNHRTWESTQIFFKFK